MSPLKTSVLATLVSCLATAAGLYYFQQGRAHEARRLTSQNNRMRTEAYQRDQARVAAATRVAAESPTTAASNPTPTPAPTTAQPAPYYRNEGNATPLATLQTFAWAGDRGDTVLVGRLLHIDPAARPKAEAFLANLPASTRAQWATVDDMAASVLTMQMMAQPFPSADILATATPELIGQDRIRLRMPGVPRDGSEYVKTTDGWKFVLTEAMVDNYLKQGQPSAAATR